MVVPAPAPAPEPAPSPSPAPSPAPAPCVCRCRTPKGRGGWHRHRHRPVVPLYYLTTLPSGATRRRSSSQLSDTLVVTACVVGAHTTCGTAATAYVPQFDRESPYPRSTPVSVDGRGLARRRSWRGLGGFVPAASERTRCVASIGHSAVANVPTQPPASRPSGIYVRVRCTSVRV
eukprot:235682-Prymnesium_polylepis.1